MVHPRRKRQAAGIEHLAGGERDVTFREILPLQADVTAFRRRKQRTDAVVRQLFGVFLDDDRVRPDRQRRSGKDAHGLAAPDLTPKPASCSGLPDDCQFGADLGDILVADGIAIHGGIIEGWMRDPCRHILRKHAAEAVMQRETFRPLRGAGFGNDPEEGLFDREQRHQRLSSWR